MTFALFSSHCLQLRCPTTGTNLKSMLLGLRLLTSKRQSVASRGRLTDPHTPVDACQLCQPPEGARLSTTSQLTHTSFAFCGLLALHICVYLTKELLAPLPPCWQGSCWRTTHSGTPPGALSHWPLSALLSSSQLTDPRSISPPPKKICLPNPVWNLVLALSSWQEKKNRKNGVCV